MLTVHTSLIQGMFYGRATDGAAMDSAPHETLHAYRHERRRVRIVSFHCVPESREKCPSPKKESGGVSGGGVL